MILETGHGLDLPSPGDAGLFHTAVLFDTPRPWRARSPPSRVARPARTRAAPTTW
ncbi:hypothetical protein WDV94_04825 [Clavibacter tessellarius]